MNTDYTLSKYLAGAVQYPIAKSAVLAVLAGRGLEDDVMAAFEKRDIDLCLADIYKMFYLGASKITDTTDADNNWKHTAGGYTLTSDDKAKLLSAANAIYGEYGEALVPCSAKISITSHGVRRAYRSTDGSPLPRIYR